MRSHTQRLMVCAASFAALCMGLAGCGSNTASTGGDSGEVVNLTYMHRLPDSEGMTLVKDIVAKWNKDHPDDQAKLSEPQYAGTSSEGGSKAAEALMSADPKLDALIPAGGGGDPLQGAIAAVERAGRYLGARLRRRRNRTGGGPFHHSSGAD